jgi:CTP synthase
VGHTTKHLFVTGGVASSLGKGLTASSLGNLLKSRGLRVTMQKLDPYLNVDPGTMNPFQHGEVFVTNDGAETDLDVGHYERFLDVDLHGSANVTTGQVYSQVIAKERRGEYLGDTVQVIPHITNEIKSRIRRMAGPEVDVVITEVGGTVGDIESLPFLEAIRQIRHEIGRDNVFFLHVSLLPYIGPSGELKTKPTQHSVAALRNIGIQPDAIVLRADREVPASIKRKISLMCDVDVEAVVAAVDAPSIYDIPKVLHSEGLDAYVVRRLDLPFRDVDWTAWDQLLRRVHHPAHEVTVALVGKYVDLPDAYLSVTEALRAGGFANDTRVNIRWVTSDDCVTPEGAERLLGDVDAVCVPGGFGVRGIEGKLAALRFTRERGIPTLGLCLGLQCMVIEYARTMCGLENAGSTEFDEATPYPVISTMADQRDVVAGERDMGGTMRLGLYPAKLADGSIVREVYGEPYIDERHRHRYEVNNDFRGQLEEAGIWFSGTSPDGRLVEFVELPREVHPYYVATQAHPELRSRPTKAHPLFRGLIAAANARRGVTVSLTDVNV